MTIKSNQNGFTAVVAFLLLVIVAIIGATGYYVYNAQKDADKNLTKTPSAIPAEWARTKNKSNISDQASLEIKEWGVSILLSPATGVGYYEVSSTDKTNPPTFLNVMSYKSDAITGPSGVSCKGEYIALLMRLKKDDPNWQDPQFVGASLAQKDIGEYRYNLATHKQYGPECFNKNKTGDYEVDPATSAKFDAVVKSFVKDFETIRAN